MSVLTWNPLIWQKYISTPLSWDAEDREINYFPEVATTKLLWRLADEPIVYSGISATPTVYATSLAVPFKDVFNKLLEVSIIFGRAADTLTDNTAKTYAYVSMHSSTHVTPQPAFSLTHLATNVFGSRLITYSRLISKDIIQIYHTHDYALKNSFARQTFTGALDYTLPTDMFALDNEMVYFDLTLADDRVDPYLGDITIGLLEVHAYAKR